MDRQIERSMKQIKRAMNGIINLLYAIEGSNEEFEVKDYKDMLMIITESLDDVNARIHDLQQNQLGGNS